MRSRKEKALWFFLALAAAAAAVLAWWTADQWLPQAQPWAGQALRRLTRPGPDTLPPGHAGRPAPAAQGAAAAASAPLVQPRKCVKSGQVTYTDQPCPPGSRELVVDGAVTSLPAR